MSSSTQIDLIKGKSSLMDQFLKWALSFGRLLIIIVEIVAFSAFMYRFVLDRQIIDLNDEIKIKQSYVESSKTREDTYRNLHDRLATIKMINEKGNLTPKILTGIVNETPSEITYNSITIGEGKINMDLNVVSFSSLTSFVKTLKKNPQLESVTITRIDNSSGSDTVKVTIVASIVGAEVSSEVNSETGAEVSQ